MVSQPQSSDANCPRLPGTALLSESTCALRKQGIAGSIPTLSVILKGLCCLRPEHPELGASHVAGRANGAAAVSGNGQDRGVRGFENNNE